MCSNKVNHFQHSCLSALLFNSFYRTLELLIILVIPVQVAYWRVEISVFWKTRHLNRTLSNQQSREFVRSSFINGIYEFLTNKIYKIYWWLVQKYLTTLFFIRTNKIVLRLFWRNILMSVRRKALVVIMLHYVSDFSRHHQVLYWSKTVLTYYSDECQTRIFSSYYISLCFWFSSPSSSSVPIKDCSDVIF